MTSNDDRRDMREKSAASQEMFLIAIAFAIGKSVDDTVAVGPGEVNITISSGG
jgi:hypothetical protein